MVERLEHTIDELGERFDAAHRVRGARRDVVAAWLDLGRDGRAPGRAACACVAAEPPSLVVRLPEPAVRPAVDDGPLAGGRVARRPGPSRRSRSGARRRPPPRPRHRPPRRPSPTPTRSTHDPGHRGRRARTPRDIDVVGVPVFASGPVPRSARPVASPPGRARVRGQGRPDPRSCPGPRSVDVVAVGLGDAGHGDPGDGCATRRPRSPGPPAKRTSLATALADVDATGPAADVAQAVAEGFVLGTLPLLGASRREAADARPRAGGPAPPGRHRARPSPPAAARGQAIGEAVGLARDLANTPPDHLNATRPGRAGHRRSAAERKLAIEVLDEDAMAEMGLGGMLGVNRAPPSRPAWSSSPTRPAHPERHRGPGRQGRDVRLGRHLAQAVRRHARR